MRLGTQVAGCPSSPVRARRGSGWRRRRAGSRRRRRSAPVGLLAARPRRRRSSRPGTPCRASRGPSSRHRWPAMSAFCIVSPMRCHFTRAVFGRPGATSRACPRRRPSSSCRPSAARRSCRCRCRPACRPWAGRGTAGRGPPRPSASSSILPLQVQARERRRLREEGERDVLVRLGAETVDEAARRRADSAAASAHAEGRCGRMPVRGSQRGRIVAPGANVAVAEAAGPGSGSRRVGVRPARPAARTPLPGKPVEKRTAGESTPVALSRRRVDRNACRPMTPIRTKTDAALAEAERPRRRSRAGRALRARAPLQGELDRARRGAHRARKRGGRWRNWGYDSLEAYAQGASCTCGPETVDKLTGSYSFLQSARPPCSSAIPCASPCPSYQSVDFLRRAEESDERARATRSRRSGAGSSTRARPPAPVSRAVRRRRLPDRRGHAQGARLGRGEERRQAPARAARRDARRAAQARRRGGGVPRPAARGDRGEGRSGVVPGGVTCRRAARRRRRRPGSPARRRAPVTGGHGHLKQLPPPDMAAGVPVAASWTSTGCRAAGSRPGSARSPTPARWGRRRRRCSSGPSRAG